MGYMVYNHHATVACLTGNHNTALISSSCVQVQIRSSFSLDLLWEEPSLPYNSSGIWEHKAWQALLEVIEQDQISWIN